MRAPEIRLANLLTNHQVLMHPLVIGEVAIGSIRNRDAELRALADLPRIAPAFDEEVLAFISMHRLFGTGIGYIDAHLLVAVQLVVGTKLWTRDKRLRAIAEKLGLAWNEPEAI